MYYTAKFTQAGDLLYTMKHHTRQEAQSHVNHYKDREILNNPADIDKAKREVG